MFQFAGTWSFVWWGLAHQIPLVATGLDVCETWKSTAVPRSIWLPNNCGEAFAHFGHVYLMRLIFVKHFPILGKVDYVAENCHENFMFQPNSLLLQIEPHTW